MRESIPETDRHGNKQQHTQRTRTPFVMVCDGASFADVVYTPEEQTHGVAESQDGDDSEGPGGSERDRVAKVEKRGCYTA